MQLELTEEQQQALEANPNQPLRLVKPRTKEVYVLVPADVYEWLKSLLEEEFDPREAYPIVDRIMAEDDAQDPHLESYQHYRREKGS